MIIKSKNLLYTDWPIPEVLAFSTTRNFPKLTQSNTTFSFPSNNALPCFSAFNLGAHVNDIPENVEYNRLHLSRFLPDKTKIQWLEQVHGDDVVDITEHSSRPIVADGAITRCKNIALAVMTADCLPILLADKNGREIAAIHCGWRPLAANIIEKTIEKMTTAPENIVAWLGPCISKSAFEVGEDVKQAFLKSSLIFSHAFSEVKPEVVALETVKLADENLTPEMPNPISKKYFADLAEIARIKLSHLGIENLRQVEECTYSNPTKYYSYRRDGKTGRMVSIISLLP